MFTSLRLFTHSRDNEKYRNYSIVRILRINLRTKSNIFQLPNAIFLKNFRLSKECFLNVLRLLDLPDGLRSTHISPILQQAVTLNLLGSGGYQRQAGADWVAPMGQSTVAKITAQVIRKMQLKLCPTMIKFVPLESTKEFFFQKCKIPGVIGCIDGSHIMILRPNENEHIFFNQKGRHSINCMIICDENAEIMAVNGRYGGSAHDSFVWRQSKEREELER